MTRLEGQESSYRQIFKATSLFGGVQLFGIIISIIRSKFIAVLLGPAGMGIVSLLNSTIGLVSSLTNFGLAISAVKDIASANETENQIKVSKVVIVFRRLIWVTGLFGALLTLTLSKVLSRLTFGNENYTLAFGWLSIILLFSQLTNGQNVLMQGMRKLQYLAKASFSGSILGLVISIPIYYLLGIDGIVPAIILTSILSLAIAWFYSSKIVIAKVEVGSQETFMISKGMIRMGVMLSLGSLITSGASYIVRIYISNSGGVNDVGLYSAGFAIISTYVGLVFTAMGTDYYPRLSGLAHDNKKAILLINQQAEIAILILAPILSMFLIFINWLVILIYSSKFIAVNEMIHWAALGMYFKAASWSIGFILLAKGASKTFFWSELAANSYMLLFNILGYKFFGLDGMGISFLIGYIFVFFQIFFIARYKYGFSFGRDFYKIFMLQSCLGLACFIIIKFMPTPFAYLIGLPLIFYSTWFSFKEIDKRIGMKNLLMKFLKR